MFPNAAITERVDRLSEELRVAAANLAAAEYRWLRLFEEFDQLEGWARQGCKTPAQWMSWACGIGPEAGRERVRVARALPELPLASQAFSTGELSYSKVRAITRIATPETETLLVEWARCATAAQLEKIVRGVRRMRRIEEAAEEGVRYARRSVQWFYDEDGMLVIRARLPAEDGKVVVEALEGVAASIAEEASGEREEPAPDASGELAPTRFRGIGELPELAAYSEDVSNLWSVRRADALRILAETTLERGPCASSRPPQLVVHVDGGLLTEDGDGDTCRIDGGPEIPAETARRLACDAVVVPMIRGPDGNPLDVGRATRKITAPMRRALAARDEHCVFPGCPSSRRLHGHHVEHWADGGSTSLENLGLICAFHHRLVHEGGYRVVHDGGGNFRFFRPDGTEIPRIPPAVGGDADAPGAENRVLGLHIDAETAVPDDYQLRPDYGLAVGLLLERLDGTPLP